MSEVQHRTQARRVPLYEISHHTLLYRINDLLRLFITAKAFSKQELVNLIWIFPCFHMPQNSGLKKTGAEFHVSACDVIPHRALEEWLRAKDDFFVD